MNHPDSTKQFQQVGAIVRHKGDYIGSPGEISINVSLGQLIFHDGCTCNGAGFAQLTPTECNTTWEDPRGPRPAEPVKEG